MADRDERLRQTLLRIASLAQTAASGGEDEDFETDGIDEEIDEADAIHAAHCVPKALPKRLAVRAAEVAMRINPVNAPLLALGDAGGVMDPMAIAVLTAKYWGPAPRRLTVSFMEATPTDLRQRILSHLNGWSKTAGITFAWTKGIGQVRISRGPGGYWSYLGTDVTLIPKNRPTMNLQGFTMQTSEAEYRRVVRHEAGHTLGFPHEHMRKALIARIDPKKAYPWFLTTYGWSKAMVDAQVLTPLNEKSIIGTAPDQTSIMCYQLPGSITHDGKPILGGKDINATDYAFASKIYPKPGAVLADLELDEEHDGMNGHTDDWPVWEDVQGVEA